ncbi:ethyl tert-butyl ether degradation protein EthD [Rhodanobacter sp. FW510-R12]|uniref:EthD family reductase n=1 Tax=unclassified Rhodanobacter TaxID=2621553 RepID=UPI0007A9DB26|nr:MULTISPECIES: EthD family reductase [unclassified Rhodanobacter]KZC16590.1 ethyl tert-butyl ether degradation protein EthD [Rhodanobacter sp. FW104-R8]KZC27548.1 ethyl tert-butyl ether degradation protein EthD [Rhodanobacter sp. FW510-T8]KZC31810.1 ethyl tert-butyl ether degradation protein EthD [Rhodanobacter sp. FW510-R10]
MIKASVMYPYAPGARFDHAYYRETHMPLVKRRMGESCRYYSIDKGLAGGSPDTAPTYLGMSHIFCDSVEAFQDGFGPHAAELLEDLRNFTDVAPVIQISEVLVERG